MVRAHVSQESQVDKMVKLLVKYSIELVSYFLPNPITIRHRSLLLPLANPNTSEITTKSILHRILVHQQGQIHGEKRCAEESRSHGEGVVEIEKQRADH